MFLFLFEIILFIVGVWMFVSGRISARLVGGMGQAQGRPVRLAGSLLMLPAIFEFLLSSLLKLLGDAFFWYILGFQMVLVAAVLIGASILVRRSLRAAKQTQASDEIKEVE